MKKEFYVYLYIFALIGVSIFLSAKNGPAKSLSWDAMGYNAYYSMLFHDADKIDYFNEINNEYKNCDALYQFHQTDSTFYTRYTMGWAITYSPFMGLAHLYAINSDNKADFYSKPYQIAAYIGTFFFLLVAWMLTWKTIRHYFDFKTSLVALIITSLGTSYFYYSFFGMGMNHHVQFFLVSLLMYLSVRYVHNPNRKHLIFMGITLALIGLVRIPDLLFSLFPLLLFIRHKLLWSLFSRQQILYTGGSLLLLIVLMSLQLIYWKVFAGSYFLNSYDSNPGEGLELSSLTIFSFLFSYRSGLIPYFPVYLIAITGMVVLFKYEKRIALTGSLTLLIFLYVVGSWSAFWYAPRAVLEALPIFVFGIAAWVKLLRKSALIILLAFCCVAFNLFKTWQTSSYVVIPTRMTKDAYYAAFWKTNPLSGSDTLFYRPHEVHFNQLEMKKWKKVYQSTYHKKMSLSEPLIMHPKNQFADEIVVRQTNIKNPNDLIINIKVQLDQKKPDIPNDFLICLSMKHMDRVYHWRAASVVNDYTIIQNKEIMWNHYLPSPRSKEDTYHIGLWLNNQTDTVKVKSFEIEMYSR